MAQASFTWRGIQGSFRKENRFQGDCILYWGISKELTVYDHVEVFPVRKSCRGLLNVATSTA